MKTSEQLEQDRKLYEEQGINVDRLIEKAREEEAGVLVEEPKV